MRYVNILSRLLLLVLISSPYFIVNSSAAVYKCKKIDGSYAYVDHPCDFNSKSEQLELEINVMGPQQESRSRRFNNIIRGNIKSSSGTRKKPDQRKQCLKDCQDRLDKCGFSCRNIGTQNSRYVPCINSCGQTYRQCHQSC